MKRVMGEDTQNAREDVFGEYLIYYEQVWPQGDLRLCQETQVTEKAKRVLLAEGSPDSRFTVFDFYRTVSECLKERRKDCRNVIKELIKATEFLEMLCINLFLFPWKKEIKTLKTFTGPFVYWIKPVLPQSTVKSILESIGYYPETDTEYRLDKSADSETVTRMGFELFLARQECEYLLEVMGQSRSWEHLEIFQQRASQAPHSLQEAGEGAEEEEEEEEEEDFARENTSLQVDAEEGMDSGHSLVDLGEECQTIAKATGGGDEDLEQTPRSLEFQPQAGTVEPGVSPMCHIMTDDNSLLEMQRSYPDLAFRKRLIFREPPGRPTGQGKQAGGRRTPDGGTVAVSDLSGPQSIAGLPESRPANDDAASPKLKGPAKSTKRLTDIRAQDKDPAPADLHPAPALSQGAGSSGAQVGSENQASAGAENQASAGAENQADVGAENQASAGAENQASAGAENQASAGAENQADVGPENQAGVGPGNQATRDDSMVADLTEKMGQMTVKDFRADENLKYPVEETAPPDGRRCHNDGKPAPINTPRDKAQPIVCNPSPVNLCSIAGCRSCDQSDTPQGNVPGCDTIKEPPHSYYIPPSTDPPCPLSPGPEAHEGHSQQQEDKLLQTYVVVEHNGKEP
ncbi:hypothetical protein AAFF_G00226080 [Aldrovandia affinis]|uniref:Spermatogenesis-associated protein 2 PUB-like domain-containing protein n=1 Tax=Aldrovandia affinis TaxID=143900 RepID=A0AAD7X2D2_9TELE|nr:hypothetical protein AAFF_G00226080 [Aldrovandia affinis]